MKRVYVYLAILLTLLSGAFIFIKINAPIKIALVGDFEEERSAFDATSILASRIAEQEINRRGILDKKIEVVIKNTDFKNLDKLFNDIKKEKIEIIISTGNSENLKSIEPYLKKLNIMCISPNATSIFMSQKDNNIYKILPDDSKEINKLMEYLDYNNIPKEFYVIYNKDNISYVNSVKEEIKAQKGKIIGENTWNDYCELYEIKNIETIKKSPGVLILSSATESAFIVQKLRMAGINDKLIIGFSWNGDFKLIENGGNAVEGVKIITPIDLSEESNRYERLNSKLKEFDKHNSMIAAGTYEAVMVAGQAYEYKLKHHCTLKEAFDKKKIYELWEDNTIVFDKYGDSQREEYLFYIKDHQFSKMEEK